GEAAARPCCAGRHRCRILSVTCFYVTWGILLLPTLVHLGSPSGTAPPSSSHRDRAAARDFASRCASSVEAFLRPASFLCLCRKRAICPRSAAVSNNSPTDPAVSKISRCSAFGSAFHC